MERVISAVTPAALLVVVIRTIALVVIGAMPGLTATMGVALLVPFNYAMDRSNGWAIRSRR